MTAAKGTRRPVTFATRSPHGRIRPCAQANAERESPLAPSEVARAEVIDAREAVDAIRISTTATSW
jgi:hypothetical protein